MTQEKHRGRGDNFPPVSAHHPAQYLHPVYQKLVRFENTIPTGQDVLDAADIPIFIRQTVKERKTLTQESVQRKEEQIAGALFERFAFHYTQLLFPDLYGPEKTSHFCNILIREAVDNNSQVIRYPFGTFSINSNIGTPDGIIVVDNRLPRVPLWFEYTAQRASLEEKIEDSYKRFLEYKALYPGLFRHTKLVMMMPFPSAVDTTRLPEDVCCSTVPITRTELRSFRKDIMTMTDGQEQSTHVLSFHAEREDRIGRGRTEQQRADDMLVQLIQNPTQWEALPNDAATYYLAHWEKIRLAPSREVPAQQLSDLLHSPTVLFPTQSLPGVPGAG